jgi:uncharacterized protein (DUF2237 family)
MTESEPLTGPSDAPLNLLGGELQACSQSPRTGFYRTGDCRTGPEDIGEHTVCAEVTDAFLRFSESHGNDLTTPRPEYGFPGLKPGDRWCVCAGRWVEAYAVGLAPPIVLEATHESLARLVEPEVLRYGVPNPSGESGDGV